MDDLTPEEKLALEQVLASHKKEEGKLIPILHDVQTRLGYLPGRALLAVAAHLGMPGGAVYGVATFYSEFRLSPPGKHPVKVCTGTACHIRDGTLTLEAWERQLGIRVGETTADRQFSLDRVACVGCCAMAPVTVFDGTVHGRVTPTRVEGIMAPFKFKHGEHKETDSR